MIETEIEINKLTAKNKAKTAKKYSSTMHRFGFTYPKTKVDKNLDMISTIIRTSLSIKPKGDVIHIPPIRGIPPNCFNVVGLSG